MPVTTRLSTRQGRGFGEPEIEAVSLDHAMWFHLSFRLDDWLLCSMQSPNA